MSFAGKHVVITGATGGIGKASALALAQDGARLTIVVRNRKKAEEMLSELYAVSGRNDHRLAIADLRSLASVRQAGEEILAWGDRIDVLQNNAGIANSVRRETEDGFEEMLAVNHLAPFLLTGIVLPLLLHEGARIVNVSSVGYTAVKGMSFDDLQSTQSFSAIKAYGQSKLANILFTVELADRLKAHGVTCNALHPGAVRTSLGAGEKGLLLRLAAFLIKYAPFLFKTPLQGAATSNYLSQSDDVANVTGTYFVNCRQVDTKPWATDKMAALRLWNISEQLADIKYPIVESGA